jgi:hypothetical protein
MAYSRRCDGMLEGDAGDSRPRLFGRRLPIAGLKTAKRGRFRFQDRTLIEIIWWRTRRHLTVLSVQHTSSDGARDHRLFQRGNHLGMGQIVGRVQQRIKQRAFRGVESTRSRARISRPSQ